MNQKKKKKERKKRKKRNQERHTRERLVHQSRPVWLSSAVLLAETQSAKNAHDLGRGLLEPGLRYKQQTISGPKRQAQPINQPNSTQRQRPYQLKPSRKASRRSRFESESKRDLTMVAKSTSLTARNAVVAVGSRVPSRNTGQALTGPCVWSTNQPTNQPTNQSINNQPTDQPNNQSINQPTDQPTNQPTNQRTK